MTCTRRHCFEDALGDAGDIAVRDYFCTNDYELLADHEPGVIARARLAYFSIEDACAPSAATRVIRLLKSPKDRMQALNEHFGRNAMDQAKSSIHSSSALSSLRNQGADGAILRPLRRMVKLLEADL